MPHGGDEVSALVLDIGASTTRAGYAGDDTPRAVFSTSYGYVPKPGSQEVSTGVSLTDAQLYIGDQISNWRPGMHATNPMRDGLIDDFNAIPQIISHAFVHQMKVNPSDHPVIVTEAPWNTPENRQKMAEIMFEEFKVPAFYIANTAVLSSFAAGKGTSLMIDIGKSMASVVPISDGFVLRKGMSYSSLPQHVFATASRLLANPTGPPSNRPPINLAPYQLIASKKPVDIGHPPDVRFNQDRQRQTTDSWLAWAQAREMEEWLMHTGGILEAGWNDHAASTRPVRHYEFPTGYSTAFGPERFVPGEMYFRPPVPPTPNLTPAETITALIQRTLENVEPDIRAALLANIVLTGGGSLMPGMADRVNNEFIRMFPAQKNKLHAPGNPIERRYGGWLGGSIVASLGTFHQLWISAEEWQEHGAAIVAQRCK